MCTNKLETTASSKSHIRKEGYVRLHHEYAIIGERKRAPLSVELSEFSLYLYILLQLYIIIYIFIYIFQVVRRARAVNAQRANVGSAG